MAAPIPRRDGQRCGMFWVGVGVFVLPLDAPVTIASLPSRGRATMPAVRLVEAARW